MSLIEAIFKESWQVLTLSAPYLLLGFTIAGLLKAFLPADFIARHLGQENNASIVKAALLGIPVPLCSCGVLPTAAAIHKQGAGKGATTAFLIATPETGVDSIAITWALLDPLMALLRPLSAFITALFTGKLVSVLLPDDAKPAPVPLAMAGAAPPQNCCDTSTSAPGKAGTKLRSGMKFAFGQLFADIANWFFIGIIIAGIISHALDAAAMQHWLGNPYTAMLAMLALATPLYVCATASTPIAAALVLKGLNPGAALVFLLAGPATNIASLTVVAKIIGRRSTVIYLVGITISSLLLGIAVDFIYSATNLPSSWKLAAAEQHTSIIGSISAIILILLFACSKPWLQRLTKKISAR